MVFNGSNLVWTLNGRTSTASGGSTPCANHVFIEKEWFDEDGVLMEGPPEDLPEEFTIIAESDLGEATCTYPTGSSDLSCGSVNNRPPAMDDNGLWVLPGTTYTVSEAGLPEGATPEAGIGEYTVEEGFCTPGFGGLTKYRLHAVANTAGPGTSTAVTLASFAVKPGSGTTTVSWETAAELDNAGFNVYRSNGRDGIYTTMNGSLIAAKGSVDRGQLTNLLTETSRRERPTITNWRTSIFTVRRRSTARRRPPLA